MFLKYTFFFSFPNKNWNERRKMNIIYLYMIINYVIWINCNIFFIYSSTHSYTFIQIIPYFVFIQRASYNFIFIISHLYFHQYYYNESLRRYCWRFSSVWDIIWDEKCKKMFLIVNERENVELDTIFMLIIFKFLFLLNVLIC